MNYGYARVSSQDQNLERQTEEFLKFGIDRKNIYSDKKAEKISTGPHTQNLCADCAGATCL